MVDTTYQADGKVPYADILAGIAEAVIYADRDGVIQAWNEGSTAIFGFTEAEAVGQSLYLIIPERLR